MSIKMQSSGKVFFDIFFIFIAYFLIYKSITATTESERLLFIGAAAFLSICDLLVWRWVAYYQTKKQWRARLKSLEPHDLLKQKTTPARTAPWAYKARIAALTTHTTRLEDAKKHMSNLPWIITTRYRLEAYEKNILTPVVESWDDLHQAYEWISNTYERAPLLYAECAEQLRLAREMYDSIIAEGFVLQEHRRLDIYLETYQGFLTEYSIKDENAYPDICEHCPRMVVWLQSSICGYLDNVREIHTVTAHEMDHIPIRIERIWAAYATHQEERDRLQQLCGSPHRMYDRSDMEELFARIAKELAHIAHLNTHQQGQYKEAYQKIVQVGDELLPFEQWYIGNEVCGPLIIRAIDWQLEAQKELPSLLQSAQGKLNEIELWIMVNPTVFTTYINRLMLLVEQLDDIEQDADENRSNHDWCALSEQTQKLLTAIHTLDDETRPQAC